MGGLVGALDGSFVGGPFGGHVGGLVPFQLNEAAFVCCVGQVCVAILAGLLCFCWQALL